MVELIDWNNLEALSPGEPGWYTLAVRVDGETRRPARVLTAVEHGPQDGRCHVLLAAAFPEGGPEVITPFSETVRITLDGIHTFVLVGASRSEEFQVRTP